MKGIGHMVIGKVVKPIDGLTPEEKKIIPQLGKLTVSRMYAKMPTNRLKAIMALYYECEYSQETIGEIFGINQSRVAQEIGLIKDILCGRVLITDMRFSRKKLKVEDVLSYLLVNRDQ
jgi:predicted DNA-binding protein YlxM (UPF0122 family)